MQSSSQFDPVRGEVVSGSSESFNARLSTSYSIFEGGRRFSELSRTKASVGSAEAQLQDQRFQVIFQTKSTFFAALALTDLLRVAQEREARAIQGLEVVEQQVRLGEATRSDLLRAQLELANARQQVLQAEANDRAGRFALGRQVGIGEPVTPEVPEGIGPRPLPLTDEEIYLMAEEASPSVQAATLSAQAAESGVGSARSAYLPSIGASGSYSWSNQDFTLDQGRTSWGLSLSASYPLFNGFGREVSVQRSRESLRVARLQEADARLAARQEADRALMALRTAELAIEIAEESVRVAEEDLRVISERYRVGVAIILDVLNSQIALTQAEADLVSARFDYEVGWAELESILGREL
jgi:outer membrane protein TolC